MQNSSDRNSLLFGEREREQMPAATQYLTNTIIADCRRALVVELSRVRFRRLAGAPGIVVVVVGKFCRVGDRDAVSKSYDVSSSIESSTIVFNVTLLQFNPIVLIGLFISR